LTERGVRPTDNACGHRSLPWCPLDTLLPNFGRNSRQCRPSHHDSAGARPLPPSRSLDSLLSPPVELNLVRDPRDPRSVPYCPSPRPLMFGLIFGLAAATALAGATRAKAEAQLLIEASTGKVLHAENATYRWYPASVTKLMTAYTTLRVIREGRISFNTLLTVSRNAAAQQPTKMGFKVGTQVTVDNAMKMLMVKSANDMA